MADTGRAPEQDIRDFLDGIWDDPRQRAKAKIALGRLVAERDDLRDLYAQRLDACQEAEALVEQLAALRVVLQEVRGNCCERYLRTLARGALGATDG